MDRSWLAATRGQYDDDTNLAARQAAFRHLVAADPMPPPLSDFSVLAAKTVLDVGCGNGLFLAAACRGGALGIGVDLSAGMLAVASSASPSAPLLRADAVRLPLADRSVDVALALWMLYHVQDRVAAVAELRRVTRPEGYVVVSTNTGERSFLDDLVVGALEQVIGRPVGAWLPPLGFTSENGAAQLSTGFERVETHTGQNRFEFTDVEVVVRYVGSMLGAIEAQNGPFDRQALLTEIGERTAAMMAERGRVEFSQRRAVFVCS